RGPPCRPGPRWLVPPRSGRPPASARRPVSPVRPVRLPPPGGPLSASGLRPRPPRVGRPVAPRPALALPRP
ncbi:hypothetical protein C3R44_21430, partial [Mycobacterium tuberculosis]